MFDIFAIAINREINFPVVILNFSLTSNYSGSLPFRQNIQISTISSNMLSWHASLIIFSWEKTLSTDQLETSVRTTSRRASLKYLKSSLSSILSFHHFQIRVPIKVIAIYQLSPFYFFCQYVSCTLWIPQ